MKKTFAMVLVVAMIFAMTATSLATVPQFGPERADGDAAMGQDTKQTYDTGDNKLAENNTADDWWHR